MILCVYTQYKSTKRWRELIRRMITKQQVKNEQMKRKQTYSLCFANALMCLNSKKTSLKSFKIISRKK